MNEIQDMHEFAELKDQLFTMRRDLLRRIGKIEKHLFRDEGPLAADWDEQAQELENDEVLTALDDTSRKELIQINAALSRFESGEYGECVTCGDQIAHKRLVALPYATLCIDCAKARE